MDTANIVVFTQNLKLDSIPDVKPLSDPAYPTVFLSSHRLFENETEQIRRSFENAVFLTFADFLDDADMAFCDEAAYEQEKNDITAYYSTIKRLKNEKIVRGVSQRYTSAKKLLLCDDLGIDEDVWLSAGYERVRLEYYHVPRAAEPAKKESALAVVRRCLKKPVFSTSYGGRKYVFYGRMDRIGYRMGAVFKQDKAENLYYVLTAAAGKLFHRAICRKNVVHISTLHESTGWRFPDLPNYRVGLIQDGYLPPNYSSLYLKFVGANVQYYAWDSLGLQIFRNQEISAQILPLRKKLYLPEPDFREVKTALCVASGAGDWTALKNRSDEDAMVIAFAQMAKAHPEIRFVYRCHPTWIHPAHQGVNSIARVAEYFAWLNLPNLVLSGNIPAAGTKEFRLSFSRNSLQQDLTEADIVFGEHSVSMIDGALQKIPFASVNMTGRRDFFCGITDMGFPHCECVRDIEEVITGMLDPAFRRKYGDAIRRYNQMTEEE